MFKAVVSNNSPLIIPVFITHKGCPFKCAFCNQKTVSGVNCINPSDVTDTIQTYLQWSNNRKSVELSFFGGNFTGLSLKEMSEYINVVMPFVNSGKIASLRCSTRPDFINEEIALFLKENKFDVVELGVQTFSEELLLKMERGNNVNSVKNANEILKKHKIKTVFQFITGYPEETEEDLSKTLACLENIIPDYARIYPFVSLPDTKIYNRIKNKDVSTLSANEIIIRSAKLYLSLQQFSVPVIRVGLPLIPDLKTDYPDNLGQVVISEMLKLLFIKGERDFIIPDSWKTSLYLSQIINKANITFF